MKRTLLSSSAFLLLLAACNRTPEQQPITAKPAHDPTRQVLMHEFEQIPVSKRVTVNVQATEEKALRKQHAAIVNLIKQMKSPAQHFVIDVSEPAKITGEKGTVISFDTKCFIDKDGNQPVYPIDVELKEIYALNDMVRENLTATSNGKLLQSKGTICITAFYKGEELKLNTGEQIRVGFPFALNKNDDYRFFYGDAKNDEVVNWDLAEVDKDAMANPQGKNVTPPTFNYQQLGFKEYLDEFVYYPDEAKRNELSARVDVSLRIGRDGKVTNIETNTTYKTFKDEITRVLNEMPAWTPAQYNDKSIASSIKLTVDFNIRRSNQVIIEANDKEIVFYPGTKGKQHSFGLNNVPAEDVYARSFSKLGWINCDRFLDDKGPKADVIVQANSYTDVKVIIKNRNSIVSGENCIGYTRFKNIPVNSEVIILSVKNEDGNISYSVQPLKLEKQNIVTPVWKKTNEDELHRAINGLTAGA